MMELESLLNDRAVKRVPHTINIHGLALHLKQVQPGDAFIAIKGQVHDGHSFVQEAINAGAVVIISEYKVFSPAHIPNIVLPDLSSRLPKLASTFYPLNVGLQLVAVTGTNGKTSTTSFIQQALNQCGYTAAQMGTLGVIRGQTPLKTGGLTTPDIITTYKTLKQLSDEQRVGYVALEASSHALTQDRLGTLPIQTGIFTNLTQDHLDYHGDMKTYAQAKAKLFQRPSLKTAIIHARSPYAAMMVAHTAPGVQIIKYAIDDPGADVSLSVTGQDALGSWVYIDSPWGQAEGRIRYHATFMLENALAAMTYLMHAGISPKQTIHAFEHICQIPGRMACIHQGNHPRVYIDFAHTPDALEKVLQALRANHPQAKIWCVFGCGGDRDKGKRSQMGAAAQAYADHAILTNDNPRSEIPMRIIDDILMGMADDSMIQIELDRAQAIALAINQATADDVVLVAGKGHETTQEIAGVVYPCSDEQFVRIAIGGHHALV